MKGAFWLLAIGTVAAFATGLISTGKTLLALDIKPGKIRKIVIHLLESKIYFDLSIYNPTQKSLKLQQITADITVDGNFIGNFDIRKEIILKPGQTGTLSGIVVNVSNLNAINTLVNLYNDRGTTKNMNVTGKVMGNGFLLPFDEVSEFNIPTNDKSVPKL